MENKKKNNQPKGKPQQGKPDCGDGCKMSEENK